ncbi:uncharacterized protein LOC125234863 [Leguminivora glycinivorella]|uniref:uncharacterized protein LOC125234863 n=1 Tax=Leguminivora glycinivorella TaxID=1035111 RepID=UPI00200E05B7|nr:uncharacterized protein LOC125234863 [Leguminivora glycinivorella]
MAGGGGGGGGGGALDGLPRWSWLLGLDLRTAALVVAAVGIVHPTAYLYSCCVHRGGVFRAACLLAAAWGGFSAGLFVGVLKGLELAYLCWEWFTLVFAPLMILLLGWMSSHCCCRLRAAPYAVLTPALAIIFYWSEHLPLEMLWLNAIFEMRFLKNHGTNANEKTIKTHSKYSNQTVL